MIQKAYTALKVFLIVAVIFVVYNFFQGFGSWFNFKETISPSSNNTVLSLQEMGELTSLQIRIEKVVDAQSSSGFADFLFGDKLLLVAAGDARLGVDLRQIEDGDVKIEDRGEKRRVTIQLPPIEVLQVTLDEEDTYVFNRNTGLLRFNQDQDLEASARQAAVESITDHVQNSQQYYDLARQSTESVLTNLLKSLEFDEVVLVFEDPEVIPPRP